MNNAHEFDEVIDNVFWKMWRNFESAIELYSQF